MKTEQFLADTLRELMEKESLENITVIKLAKICCINRQTFYYHFRDIYDLLAWIYLNEKLPCREEKSYEAILADLFQYLQENHSLVKNTLSSAGKDLLVEFFLSQITPRIAELFSKKKWTNSEKKFQTHYVAFATVHTFLQWLEVGTEKAEWIQKEMLLMWNRIERKVS